MINNVLINLKYHVRNQVWTQSNHIGSHIRYCPSKGRSHIRYIVFRKVDILVLEQVADELLISILKNLPK